MSGRRILAVVIVVAVGYFFAREMRGNWQALSVERFTTRWEYLGVAALLACASYLAAIDRKLGARKCQMCGAGGRRRERLTLVPADSSADYAPPLVRFQTLNREDIFCKPRIKRPRSSVTCAASRTAVRPRAELSAIC